MRAEVRRKELLERKLKGEVEEEEVEGEMGKEEAKIDETEDAGGWRGGGKAAGVWGVGLGHDGGGWFWDGVACGRQAAAANG